MTPMKKSAVFFTLAIFACLISQTGLSKMCVDKSDWAIAGYYFNNVRWDVSKPNTDPTNFNGPPSDKWTGKVTFKRQGITTEAWSIQDGSAKSHEKWDDSGKILKERWTYKNNCAHGKIRTDAGSSWLDATYEEGEERGLQVRITKDNGKVEEEWTVGPNGNDGVRVKYDTLGNITSLECDPPISVSPKHRELCGLDGKQSQVQLYQISNGKAFVWKQLGFLNGKQNGIQKVFNEAGREVASVNYKNGEKHGIEQSGGVSYGKTGDSTVSYVNGKEEGKEIRYFKNSKKVQFEIEWKSGEVVGELEYYLNGHKKIQRVYENGSVHITTYTDEGKKETSSVKAPRLNWWGQYYVPDGKVIHYDENENKSYEATYRAGERHGVTLFYFQNSNKVSQKEVWDKGTLTLRTEYTQDGKVEKTTEYFPDGSKKILGVSVSR